MNTKRSATRSVFPRCNLKRVKRWRSHSGLSRELQQIYLTRAAGFIAPYCRYDCFASFHRLARPPPMFPIAPSLMQPLHGRSFAKLGQPANIPPEPEISGGDKKPPRDQDIGVGDLIQVEIDGSFALEKPARVRAIQEHDGRAWVFIEGSKAGVPMDQAKLEQKGKSGGNSVTPPELPENDPPPLGTRKEVFALDEGDVVLSYPSNLSTASYEELEAYLQLFLRKAKRRSAADRKRVEQDGDGPR